MAKKIHMPQKLAVWIEARKRFRLSHAHIQMARELGMNPKRLGKIEHLYYKRFGRYRPESVRSIEQLVKDRNKKKEERKKRKEERSNQVTKPVEPDEVALEDPF
jgi:hypothetical protein